jgi:cyclase
MQIHVDSSSFQDPFGAGQFPYEFVTLGGRCHAFVDRGGLSNVGVIEADEGLVLIDSTLHPFYITNMVAHLARLFAKPVRHVVNTHFHRDHTFGNAYAACTEDIIAHERCKHLLDAYAAPMQLEMQALLPAGLRLAGPTRCFSGDSWVIPDLSVEIVLVRTGGHTEDSCFVHVPEDGVCFAGDSVFNGVPPYLRQWSCLDHFGRITSWLHALERIGELGAACILPGHGDVATRAVVDGLRRFFEYYADIVARGVASGRRLREIWFELLGSRDFLRAELPKELYLHMTLALYDDLTGPADLYVK